MKLTLLSMTALAFMVLVVAVLVLFWISPNDAPHEFAYSNIPNPPTATPTGWQHCPDWRQEQSTSSTRSAM